MAIFPLESFYFPLGLVSIGGGGGGGGGGVEVRHCIEKQLMGKIVYSTFYEPTHAVHCIAVLSTVQCQARRIKIGYTVF